MEGVQAFIDRWSLTAPGVSFIEQLPPKRLGVIVRSFHSPCELTHWDGIFIDCAASMAEAWRNGSPPTVTEAQAFMYRWYLDGDTMKKLQGLRPQLVTLIIRTFGPLIDASTWNTKFIEHAASMERAWRRRGVDSFRAAIHVVLSPGAASTS